MTKAGEIVELLDILARRFENAEQRDPQLRGGKVIAGTCGWGQFLDASKLHRQVGPYGTSAGLLVLGLAGRGPSALTQQASKLLRHWWDNQNADEYAHERLVQTVRLAFLNLAMRLSGLPECVTISIEIERALAQRLLPAGMWGNFWINERNHDASPRVFPSAISLLSFSLLREDPSSAGPAVLQVADRLEDKLLSSKSLSMLEVYAASAAIMATKRALVSRRAQWRLSGIARESRHGFGERPAYFYDYEYSPGTAGHTRFGRDYFIISAEILLGIAGFQPGAPSALRLRAESSLRTLIENIRLNQGAYRPEGVERLHSKEQAWAAILLKVSSDQYQPPGRPARILYALLRERRGNWFWNNVFPVGSLLLMTALNVVAQQAGLLVSVVGAVGLAVISALFGSKYVRKLFPGRE